jgi:hypothetical protein
MEGLTLGQITALDVVGVITIMVSTAGAVIAFMHWRFFVGNGSKLSAKLRALFLTDAIVYISTLLFGVWAWALLDILDSMTSGREELLAVRIGLYSFRILALIANIWAALRLYQHYYEATDDRGA